MQATGLAGWWKYTLFFFKSLLEEEEWKLFLSASAKTSVF